MSEYFFDEVGSGALSAAGSGSWISIGARNRLHITLSGTFTGLNAVLESSTSPGNAGSPIKVVASYSSAGTADLTDLPDGFYRFRVISIASGSVTYNTRAFRKTILFDNAEWDDLRSPATAINPTGPANAAGIDSEDGGLLFDRGTVETCSIIQQMPHSWVEGSAIMPHVHWTKTTSAAGAVVWKLEYQIANAGDVFPGVWTTDTASSPSPVNADTNTANQHLITSFKAINMSGYLASCMIKTRISRVANDAADTYGADAKLLEFDVHYLVGSLGSGGEFVR